MTELISILSTIKKKLGVLDEYTHFDEEIILDINTVFVTLNQLGVGPEEPFVITGYEQTWDDFFDASHHGKIESVKTYMALKVRLLFDPPQSSYLVSEVESQLSELEFRMLVQAEKDLLPEADMSGIYK